MNLSGLSLKMSASRRPQTDGALEIMDRMIENYLRFCASYHQKDWDELLPAAESAYKFFMTEHLDTAPFEMGLG